MSGANPLAHSIHLGNVSTHASTLLDHGELRSRPLSTSGRLDSVPFELRCNGSKAQPLLLVGAGKDVSDSFGRRF